MTVQTDSARKSTDGDGSTVAFAFPYRFLVDADLKVYVRDANGNETLKTITTDYTVTGAGDGAGGTVTFLAAPIVGETVVIIRDPDLLQEIDYSEGDAFPAETHESGLDKLTMVVQRLKDRQDRSFELGETDTQGSGEYDVGGNRLSNVGTGTADSDAATVAQFNAWVLQIAADATAASTAKTDAETAQGLAETAKTDAETAKTAAETALDEITDLYLGAKTADPATDNDGDPLQAAAWYLRTTDSVVRVYNGSAWNDLSNLASLADGSITNLKISNALDAAQKANFRDRIGVVAPTVQVLTSGSGTYNTPSGCKGIWIRLVGGGGGAGSNSGAGTAGGNTTFATLTAGGGANSAGSGNNFGGAGGSASGGDVNILGGYGGPMTNQANGMEGGMGGSSVFGGAGGGAAGAGNSGGNAAANSGSGGGGISTAGGVGSAGGGSGGYVEKLIASPSTTYSYAVGAGGAGAGGSPTGGAGAAGIIIVTEFY